MHIVSTWRKIQIENILQIEVIDIHFLYATINIYVFFRAIITSIMYKS